jgi:hypothetical protein
VDDDPPDPTQEPPLSRLYDKGSNPFAEPEDELEEVQNYQVCGEK